MDTVRELLPCTMPPEQRTCRACDCGAKSGLRLIGTRLLFPCCVSANCETVVAKQMVALNEKITAEGTATTVAGMCS